MQIARVMRSSDAAVLFASLLMLSQTSHQEVADGTYWAEVMIEGNETLSVLNVLLQFENTVLNITGINITDKQIAAVCKISGQNTTCWCGTGYVWTNLVCDSVYKCCNTDTCVLNISQHTSLCVPKVNVLIFGKVTSGSTAFPTQIESAFRVLNGFNSWTQYSHGTNIAPYQHNFTVDLSSVFSASKVENIISTLLTQPDISSLRVTSLGIVHMEVPAGKVCYNSTQQLQCTSLENMQTCLWQITRGNEQTLTLGPGKEITLSSSSNVNTSTVTLNRMTEFWSGTYTCLFVTGNVTHMASAPIQIALLPELISVAENSSSVDCTMTNISIFRVVCLIRRSSERYTAQLKFESVAGTVKTQVLNDSIKYSAAFSVNCTKTITRPLTASCTITNTLNQTKNATVKIPVIFKNDLFCEEEESEERLWPKTKDNQTVVLDCASPGKEGTITRRCTGDKWGNVVSLCVKTALNTLTLEAVQFEKGIGATPEIASAIFQGLRNSTESENSFGDVKAAVSVFESMKKASVYVTLGENLLPDFIESASSMLNISWDIGDKNEMDALATQYLSSVEGLIQSIKIDNITSYNSTKIQLQVCRSDSSCNISVFNVNVDLNVTADMVKTIGIQNLSDRLPKHSYENNDISSIVVSTTVENVSSSVNIRLAFQTEESLGEKQCVFWNVSEQRWSTEGCKYIHGNTGYCECNHLSSFSMLMSKNSSSSSGRHLELITYIGLGISVCSLILYIVIECVVWKVVVKSSLSFFRHTTLINISLCLLLADCSFLASSLVSKSILNDTLCLVLVLAKHYFFLAMFFWMFCLSIMLVHQLIFVFSHIGKKVYMMIAFTVGYICPTVTVTVTYMYYSQRDDVKYYETKNCWLTYKSAMVGSIHAFLVPVGTIVLVNIFAMVMVIVTVLKPSGSETGKIEEKDAAKAVIKVILFLTPVFGGTWVLGFFVFLKDDFLKETFLKDFIDPVFTVVNSLQGLFILLTGCFAEKKVLEEILRIVLRKKIKDHSVSKK